MRYDLRAKKILKDNNIQLQQYNKNTKAPIVKARGIEVFQQYGQLVITLNGYDMNTIKGLLKDLDCEIIYYK